MTKGVRGCRPISFYMVLIACDGSSLRDFDGNVGKGPIGWAYAREDGFWYANGYHVGTNQRAELLGLIMVLLTHMGGKLHVQLDSKYVLNTAEKWMWGWVRKGWTKSDGAPVANIDLVKTLHELMVNHGVKNVEFEWVKGHDEVNGSILNHVADVKANETSNRVKSFLKEGLILPTYFQNSNGDISEPSEHDIYVGHKPS